jgi:hypothetical protein
MGCRANILPFQRFFVAIPEEGIPELVVPVGNHQREIPVAGGRGGEVWVIGSACVLIVKAEREDGVAY